MNWKAVIKKLNTQATQQMVLSEASNNKEFSTAMHAAARMSYNLATALGDGLVNTGERGDV